MTDVGTRIANNAISALIAAAFDSRRQRENDARQLRREAARDLLTWVPDLRRLLQTLEVEQNFSEWLGIVSSAYASCWRVQQIVPESWGHLRQSMWDLLGNGAGSVAWLDIDPNLVTDDLEYETRWTSNAIEYLEYAQRQVQQWMAAFASRDARRVRLDSYNNWLNRTGR